MSEAENNYTVVDTSKGVNENVLLNRKINYSIIRYLWDIVKGYVDSSPWSDDNRISLYEAVNIKRTRYNRIVYTEYAMNLDKTAHSLHKLTSIERDIFNGKKAFHVEGINHEDWERHFDLFRIRRLIKQDMIIDEDIGQQLMRYRAHIKFEKGIEMDKKNSISCLDSVLKEFTSKLKTILKNNTYNKSENSNLFLLYYFIKFDKAFTTSTSIETFSKALNGITWEELTSVSEESLSIFIKSLKMQLKLAEAAEILKGKTN